MEARVSSDQRNQILEPLNVKFETFPKRELRQHRQFSKLEFLSSALRMLINCVIPLQEILSFVLYKIMSV